ncbi:MAG TPA: hypothetical protein IGS40_17475 [Trichormus sp. M33_DOE_039]|nr:hypothetical protein [Trichormus sp. M33_DOE_039]
MPNRRYPPAYLRYLKARLMNLGRPSFWGTAIFLSVVGLLIHEYWANPDIFGARNNSGVNSSDPLGASLSAEDRAIAADIDNLPLLLNTNEPLILPTPLNNSQDDKNKNSSPDTTSKQKSTDQKSQPIPNNFDPLATSQNQNIFVSQSENLLRFGATDNKQLLGFTSSNSVTESTAAIPSSARTGTGLVNPTNDALNTNSVNNLSTAVNSTNTQNTSSLNGANSSAITPISSDSYGRTAPIMTSPNQTFSPSIGINSPTNYLRSNGYNNFNNPQQSFSPSTRINSPTNYLQPNTINPQPGVYNNLSGQPVLPGAELNARPGYIQPTTTNIQPGSYTNFNNNQVVPNQVPATTTVITGTSPIIGPYTIRNPRPSAVINTTPLVPSNYGNSIWQQPNQIPQSNFPYTRQTQGQYVNGVPNNGY